MCRSHSQDQELADVHHQLVAGIAGISRFGGRGPWSRGTRHRPDRRLARPRPAPSARRQSARPSCCRRRPTPTRRAERLLSRGPGDLPRLEDAEDTRIAGGPGLKTRTTEPDPAGWRSPAPLDFRPAPNILTRAQLRGRVQPRVQQWRGATLDERLQHRLP